MSGFKETEIGLMPESWDIVPLEQTGEVVYGIQAAVANLTKPIGTKILTNINITFDGKINLNQLRYYPLTKARHFKTVLKKGDILFNWRSGSKDHVGKTAFFDLDGEFTHSSFILRIRTNDKVVNKYIFYYLTYLRSSGYFRKLQNYSVNAKFNASAVNALPTAVPLYKEQQNITHILSKIQSAIETQEKIIQTTIELKKALMQKLFTEGLKGEPQKETEIGLVPKSWQIVTINDVCEPPQYGFTDTSSKQGNAKFLRITDIQDFGVNWGTVPYCNCSDLNKHLLKENDIVVARIGATTGKSYIIKNPPVSVFASYLIRLRAKADLNADYLFYFCNSPIYWLQINASKGNNLKKGVSGSVLKTVKLPYPSLEEQIQIANTFEQIDKKSAMALKKKAVLTYLFQSMLHHLMTGQIRVKDLKFS